MSRLRFFSLIILFYSITMSCWLLPAVPQSTSNTSTAERSSEDNTFAQIEALITSKKYAAAESLVESCIIQGTPTARAYARMGRIYLDRNEWSRAADYLQKSLKTEDGNDQAYLFLGLANRELKEPEEAEEEFIKAATLNPRSDVNAYFAGQQLLFNHKFDAALSYFYEALKLNPRNASAYRALGSTQVRLGNYGLAEQYYRKSVELLGDSKSFDSASLLDLTVVLLLGHHPEKVEEALKLARRAAVMQASSADAHYLAGKALMKQGRVEDALPELRLAAQLNPKDSKAHFQLALAYERLGDKAKARAERQELAKTKHGADQQGMASEGVLPRIPE